jgi:hypothetical protein
MADKSTEATKTSPTNGAHETNGTKASNGSGGYHETAAVKTNGKEIQDAKTTRRRSNIFVIVIGHFLRTLILDIPLMTLFALYISTILLHGATVKYYIPQINLMKWNRVRQVNELTYYNRLCRDDDVTTNNTADLLIHPDMDSEDCMLHMLKNGVSIYPNLISDETASAARDFILKRNKLEENWGVISNKNRWSFGIDVNSDPSIQKALKEISANEQLNAALRKIVGPDAAVIEFTGITAAYGAADQYLHKDVVPRGSAFRYGRNFVPSYSLFIPLQDITAEMGSTEVCPGTHMCTASEYNPCDEKSMFVSGKTGSWKSGYGALVNQQLYHRGTAHKDPKGPDRVLFILTFAGRPRFAKNQLESRLIGFEGSYSLKWDQWGHTLRDFANPEKHMIEPWRKLRALGLYKAPDRKWGWDYLTVASMRIANADTSYTPDDLVTFAEKGGYDFIPSFLKAELGKNDDWTDFLLNQITNVMKWLQKVNLLVIAAYVGVLVVVDTVMRVFGLKGNGSVVVRALSRLVVTHGLILLVAYLIACRVHSSQWAENIRHEKAFRGYRKRTRSPLKGTLPNEMDVLIDTRYQSSYLASYNRLLDVQHPGNTEYHRLVDMNSVDYYNLPPSAQQDLTESIVNEMKASKHGRLLKQTEQSTWAVMPDNEALAQVHLDLTKASCATLEFILTQLEYFWNELSAGVFRETALHKKHMPELFKTIQKKLIGSLPVTPKQAPGACRPDTGMLMTVRTVLPTLSPLARLSASKAAHVRRSIPTSVPPSPEAVAPWPGAWIEEGDAIDALYKGTTNGKSIFFRNLALLDKLCLRFGLLTQSEYYTGVVVHANANKGVYNVLYDDGEKDDALCHICIRPRKPIKMDELLRVRNDGVYYDGRIVAMHDGGTFDVLTEKIGLKKNVTMAMLQRSSHVLEVGAVIQALFQGKGDTWYRGRISKVNKDGTFDVVYSDGDKEYSVEPEHIRF